MVKTIKRLTFDDIIGHCFLNTKSMKTHFKLKRTTKAEIEGHVISNTILKFEFTSNGLRFDGWLTIDYRYK